jgi:hypothetical protein
MTAFLTPNFENIPAELRALPHWVTWCAEGATGEKPRKVPYAADRPHTRASSTDPSTWGTFHQAEAAYLEGDRTGIGFVLNGDGMVGVDIDHCVTDGLPNPAALTMLDQLGAAYVELSPSGTGLRAFGYAENLPSGCKGQYNGLDVELYSTGRYLTLTGQPIKTGPFTKLNDFAALADHLRADRKVDSTTGMVTPVEPTEKQGALLQRVLSGDVYHDSLRDLAASLVATGMHPGAVVNHLRAVMDSSAGAQDDRWVARRNQIPDLVNSASKKFPSNPGGTIIDSETGEIHTGTGVENGTGLMRLVSIADVLTNPQPPHPFMWGPYLPSEALTLLSGHGGTGKSGFVLQLAVHVALGLQFLGLPVMQERTLYFSAEDAASILRSRVADICRNHDVDPVELAQHLHVMDATDAAVLWQSDGPRKPGEPTPNYAALRQYIHQHEIGFVAVDNASDTFGADRFDKSQVTQFVRALVRLVRARGGAVLLLSHVNRTTAASKPGNRSAVGESYSDSVAWHNAARSRLFLAGDDIGEALTLEHEKSNYGKKCPTPLSLRRMEGCGLEVVQPSSEGSPAQGIIDSMHLTCILPLIDEFYKRGEFVSTSTTAHTNAHKLLSNERGYPKGLEKKVLWTLLRGAERKGLIVREDYQSAHRNTCQRWRVATCPPYASSAFSVSSPNENAETEENAGGTRAASSHVGGVGGEDARKRQRTAKRKSTANTSAKPKRKPKERTNE